MILNRTGRDALLKGCQKSRNIAGFSSPIIVVTKIKGTFFAVIKFTRRPKLELTFMSAAES